ncbi:MAG: hypothetical protein IKL83_00825 [Muribaculaceae bacterium]|nr:hypothetical protein [Muribaculaceae bacterium]
MRNFLTLCFAILSGLYSLACTSAIISGALTRDGRPILWKNRDTSHLVNYVAITEATDSTHAYVALYNSQDTIAAEAWIGYNDAGFAIMNIASYNLNHPADNWKDREGFLMTKALAYCTTVDDFQILLKSLPKPLGVEANFGVIDAYGNGGFFETDDLNFTFYPLDNQNRIIIRTNFSVSGGDGGLGYVRYDNACHLLAPHIDNSDISPELLTDSLSRSFYYSPDSSDKSTEEIVLDKDFIPRHSTSASIAIEGVNSPDETNQMVMWTLMGYPPCGITQPVTLDSLPDNLIADDLGGCKASRDNLLLKEKVFYKKGRQWFIKMPELQHISNRNKTKSLNNYQRFRTNKK